MNYKQGILVVIFVSLSTLLTAQIHHDLKVQVLPGFLKEVGPSYELVMPNNISVEATLLFNFANLTITNFDLQNLETFSFGSTRLTPSLAARYYTGKKKEGYGLFVGPYIAAEYSLHREEGYVMKREEISGFPLRGRILFDRGIKQLDYGLTYGYKWKIKSAFIIDLVFFVFADREVGQDAVNVTSGLSSDMSLRIGYRF